MLPMPTGNSTGGRSAALYDIGYIAFQEKVEEGADRGDCRQTPDLFPNLS